MSSSALAPMWTPPLKLKCWTNSVVPLYQSLLWGNVIWPHHPPSAPSQHRQKKLPLSPSPLLSDHHHVFTVSWSSYAIASAVLNSITRGSTGFFAIANLSFSCFCLRTRRKGRFMPDFLSTYEQQKILKYFFIHLKPSWPKSASSMRWF